MRSGCHWDPGAAGQSLGKAETRAGWGLLVLQLGRALRLLGKMADSGLNQGKLKMSLSHLGNQKGGNDPRALGAHGKNIVANLKGLHWPNLRQLEHWDNDKIVLWPTEWNRDLQKIGRREESFSANYSANNQGKMMERDCCLAAIQVVITQPRHKWKPVGERLMRKETLLQSQSASLKHSVLQREK